MITNANERIAPIDEGAAWTRIGIVSGLFLFRLPMLILVDLPSIPQVILGASFGPALVVASVALKHILEGRRSAPSIELAAICNSLAGALVTAEITVQLAINYSTTPADDQTWPL